MSTIPFITFSTPHIHENIRQQLLIERQQQQQQKSKDNDDPPRGQKYAQSNRIPTIEQLKELNAKLKSNVPFASEMYNYNLKFMNSVWGQYNRYAPQAFQKNMEFKSQI